MTDFNTDMNVQLQSIDPIKLIHEYSSTEYYMGVSNNGNATDKPIWQIKRILKDNDVWSITGFPDGDQSFKYVWDLRLTYNYL